MATGDLELPEDEAEKQRLEEQRHAYAGLCALMKEVLSDKVEKARTPLDLYMAQVEVTRRPVHTHAGAPVRQDAEASAPQSLGGGNWGRICGPHAEHTCAWLLLAALHAIQDRRGRMRQVVVGSRALESPCVLTTGEYGWSANMQRIMRAQALRDDATSSVLMCVPLMRTICFLL